MLIEEKARVVITDPKALIRPLNISGVSWRKNSSVFLKSSQSMPGPRNAG